MSRHSDVREGVRAALRSTPFRRLTAARFVVTFGNGVAPIALAFAVLDLTGSVRDLGLVVGARSLANVVFVLFGGIVSDRLPRQVVMVAACVLAAITQAAVAGTVLVGAATTPLLIALSALNGMVIAFAYPAAMAIVPQTVSDEARKQANAINRLALNTAMIAGAASGGILVAAIGPGWGLALDAATFALAGLIFAFVRVPAYRTEPSTSRSVFRELRDGWTEFVAHTWVWVVVLAFMFFNMAVIGAVNVLGPAIADHTIGRPLWGVVLAAQTAGMVAGGFVAIALRVRRLLLVGVICASGALFFLLGLALAPRAVVLIPAAFATGIAMEQFSIAWDTSLQDNIRPERLARVYSYDVLGSFLAIPIGQVGVGPLANAVGVSNAMLVAAAVVAVAVASMLVIRDVRTLEHGPGVARPSTSPAATDPAAVG